MDPTRNAMYNELAELDPDLKAMLEAQALYLFKGHDLNKMLKKNIDAILFKMMKEIFEQKDGMNDDCYNNLCLKLTELKKDFGDFELDSDSN